MHKHKTIELIIRVSLFARLSPHRSRAISYPLSHVVCKLKTGSEDALGQHKTKADREVGDRRHWSASKSTATTTSTFTTTFKLMAPLGDR